MQYGVHQYRRSEGGALSPREMEAAAFAFVNRLLDRETDLDCRMQGLAKNQALWSLLLRDVSSSSNTLPEVLKSDVTSLGFWVMRHTIAAMGDVSMPLVRLREVNQDMIEALRAVMPRTGQSGATQVALAIAG